MCRLFSNSGLSPTAGHSVKGVSSDSPRSVAGSSDTLSHSLPTGESHRHPCGRRLSAGRVHVTKFSHHSSLPAGSSVTRLMIREGGDPCRSQARPLLDHSLSGPAPASPRYPGRRCPNSPLCVAHRSATLSVPVRHSTIRVTVRSSPLTHSISARSSLH